MPHESVAGLNGKHRDSNACRFIFGLKVKKREDLRQNQVI
jgi:hypothetical protein